MDWRRRNYYLVTISYLTYEMRMKYYRMAAPSLKIHAPYGHFKNGKELDRFNDGAKGHEHFEELRTTIKTEVN